MNWDTVHVSLLTPFGYDWRGSHFLIDITKIRLIFELQNILRENFVNLTTINVSGWGVMDEIKRNRRDLHLMRYGTANYAKCNRLTDKSLLV